MANLLIRSLLWAQKVCTVKGMDARGLPRTVLVEARSAREVGRESHRWRIHRRHGAKNAGCRNSCTARRTRR